MPCRTSFYWEKERRVAEGLILQAGKAFEYTSETRVWAATISIATRVSTFAVQHLGSLEPAFDVLTGTKEIGWSAKHLILSGAEGWRTDKGQRSFWAAVGGAFVVCSAVSSLIPRYKESPSGDLLFLGASSLRLYVDLLDYRLAEKEHEKGDAYVDAFGSASCFIASIISLTSKGQTATKIFYSIGTACTIINFIRSVARVQCVQKIYRRLITKKNDSL